jgi:alkanesulfonate monooxygenase SsuD/methylene tetrahydromethanopterin reductase-like flavin-dependent oxidoreductase (luciferase family)
MTHPAPFRLGSKTNLFRYSIFCVQDHYPSLPRTLAQFYAELSDQAMLAEELGYDTLFLAEHHFDPYGTVPNPAVALAYLAAKTRQLRLGSAISVLSYHPAFEVAENYSMVDILSGGRVTLGVGSGYLAHELAGYGIDLATKRERYDENMAVLQKALTGARFSYRGSHQTIDEMQLNVAPVQALGLPIYVAVSAPPVAYYVGRQAQNMMFVPYSQLQSIADIGAVFREYRRGTGEAPIADGGARFVGDVAVAFHAHVAATDEEARARAKDPFELYLRTRQRAKHQSFEAIASEDGLSLVGSAQTVAAKLGRLYAEGVRHLMLVHNFGAMPADAAADSMRRFALEAMPLFLNEISNNTEAVTI